MLVEYFILLVFFTIIIIVVLLLPVLSEFLITKNDYREKVSAYECGFQPFEGTMSDFEVRYYITAIIFLIFDLELVFILPWIVILEELTIAGLLSMYFFFIVLILGFYYEWVVGGLEWA